MVTLFGPETIIFLAISTPNPLSPIIKIFNLESFSIVSIPKKIICREYKSSSILLLLSSPKLFSIEKFIFFVNYFLF